MNFFFFLGDRNFIEIDEHCVDDNNHSEMKQNTYNSRTKACRLQKIINGDTLSKIYELIETKFQIEETLRDLEVSHYLQRYG